MLKLLRLLSAVISPVLMVGRQIAWIALAIMVFVILLQVFTRYVLNDALTWPDEAARFLMLWMTGLMAPSAFRWGGFVAIDTLPQALPRSAALPLTIFLLLASLFVLIAAIGHGHNHTMGFGGNFDSSSLRLPLDWFGYEAVKVKLRYMYASLFVCVILLTVVNVELLLRAVYSLFNPDEELPDLGAPEESLGAD